MSPAGTRLWRLKYCVHGHEKLLALGSYPQISLRKRAGEIGALRRDWIDEKALTITLPASITKNKRQHAFPQSADDGDCAGGPAEIG